MTTTEPVPPADDCFAPGVGPLPTGAEVASLLSMRGTLDAEVQAELDKCAADAADEVLAKLRCSLMVADGAAPPGTVPEVVARAVRMRAAALWRRRNSVNGFDGYEDLGTVPIRATDPDISGLIDRYRAHVFA